MARKPSIILVVFLSCLTFPTLVSKTDAAFQVSGFRPIEGEEIHEESYFGRTFVFFRNLKLNWMKAHVQCKRHGMRLLTVEGPAEVTFLKPLLERHINLSTSRAWQREVAWVGATDLYNEGHFTLIETGRDFPISLFAPAQPDNANKNEHCVEFRQWDQWERFGINDIPCEVLSGVVCEYVHPR